MIIEKEIFGQKMSYDIGDILDDPDLYRVGYRTDLQRINLRICYTQAELYQHAVHLNYDIRIFSDVFMHSNFCKNSFDKIYSNYHEANCVDIWREIYPDIKDNIVLTKDFYIPTEAWWIGFVYRMLHIETNLGSDVVSEKIPFSYLEKIYFGYESTDIQHLAEIICDEFSLKRYKYE